MKTSERNSLAAAEYARKKKEQLQKANRLKLERERLAAESTQKSSHMLYSENTPSKIMSFIFSVSFSWLLLGRLGHAAPRLLLFLRSLYASLIQFDNVSSAEYDRAPAGSMAHGGDNFRVEGGSVFHSDGSSLGSRGTGRDRQGGGASRGGGGNHHVPSYSHSLAHSHEHSALSSASHLTRAPDSALSRQIASEYASLEAPSTSLNTYSYGSQSQSQSQGQRRMQPVAEHIHISKKHYEVAKSTSMSQSHRAANQSVVLTKPLQGNVLAPGDVNGQLVAASSSISAPVQMSQQRNLNAPLANGPHFFLPPDEPAGRVVVSVCKNCLTVLRGVLRGSMCGAVVWWIQRNVYVGT